MNNNNGGKHQGGAVPVANVLLTVSNEIRMLSDSAADLQNLIGNLVVAGAFGGSQSIYELQSLDRICQNLGAVADFLQGLSEDAPIDWKIDAADAARGIKLADVAQRLAGSAPEDQETGEFEDFGNWPMTG
ncbi:MAG TPA: hypothetical protein PKE16_03905 [Hyphomicrobium sp.]|nr:hypothetical protein [Hyphomicrobium sp.]